MTANATSRSIRSLMRKLEDGEKLNILTFATHERYEENLCKTGHNFYSLKVGKEWDTSYAKVPDNYHIVDSLPSHVDFDILLSHTACQRYQYAHDLISQTSGSTVNRMSIPSILHTHVLPDVRRDINSQIAGIKSINPTKRSFISDFSRSSWGFDDTSADVIEHGIDTDFWTIDSNAKRDDVCLSVVNDWPNRDWCCGFNLWQRTAHNLPLRVYGKSPGLSEPANNIEHLRNIYQNSSIFYNTSLHSPVPTVLMEAMACGCAIVSTATCMIPEIIKHGENGFISNNEVELRAYLEMLLNNPALARKLGDNARKTIEEKYGIDKFLKSWNDLLYKTVENYSDINGDIR